MQEYAVPKKMTRVGDLFLKYQTTLQAPQASVEKACVVAIKEVAGFVVSQDCVTYTVATRTISLRVPSVLKSELQFYTEKILARLEQELGAKSVPKTVL